ncbi:MAG TPA: response regulator FixJ [Phenylobacterium sp.]|jgi:two-component system response regulator FixJ|nr:response regulator FixJ [Phenylobacterium sp.]
MSLSPDPADVPDACVFVIDDDAAVLNSLKLLLRTAGLRVVGFQSAVDFLDHVTPERHGCVVTDVLMPGIDGIELIRRLRARGVRLPVIVMTGHADVGAAVQAMKAGASEFIEKPFESERILRMIHALIDQDRSAFEVRSSRDRIRRRLAELSVRERQVFDCIVEGAGNKAAAAQLGISPRTVEIYRAKVMIKMQAESLSDLVRMAIAADESPKRT